MQNFRTTYDLYTKFGAEMNIDPLKKYESTKSCLDDFVQGLSNPKGDLLFQQKVKLHKRQEKK